MRIFTYLILILIPLSSFAQEQSSGLKFLSHQVSKEMRTSLYMEEEEGIRSGNYFNLTFDYSLYPNKKGRFGQICKINVGEDSSIDLIYNIKNVRDNYLSLLINGQIVKEWAIDSDTIIKDGWNQLSITLLPRKHSIFVSNNSDTLTIGQITINRKDRVKFFFGAAKGYSSKDVSSFILGKVCLSSSPGKEKYLWNMDRHGEDYVIDCLRGKKLIVENPEWLMDNHIKWSHEKSVILPRFHFVQDNGDNLYIITEDSLCVYSLTGKESSRYKFEKSLDLLRTSNHFIWHEGKLAYLNIDDSSHSISVFDYAAGAWNPEITSDERRTIHANVMAYGKEYLQMFGYGFHKYSDRIYVVRDGKATRFNVPAVIPPRYLGAIGINNGRLYIYSGVGNKSGEQMSGTEIYNDFWGIDLEKGKEGITELSSFPSLKDEVAAENLLFISGDDSFYALFFNPFKDKSYLQLKKMDIHDGIVTELADKIPYLFHDINSEARLIFSRKENKLYAVTKHLRDEKENEYELNVYSVNYPVLRREDVILNDLEDNDWRLILAVVSVILIAALCTTFIILRRRRRTEEVLMHNNDVELRNPVQENLHHADDKTAGVYLLGGFHVINKDGDNITGKFTPVTTQLLCLIILYTARSSKGIPSAVLKDILWSDKSDESALNNRSVNIRKVRKILQEVGDYRILHENSYWKFAVPDDLACDVINAVAFLKEFNNKKHLPVSEDLEKISAICSCGSLLTDLLYDWLDDFKFSYNTMVIDALNKALTIISDNAIRVSFADAIIRFSPLDEEALKVKCAALAALGKNGLAKSTFEAFAKEYETTMGEPLPYSFESVYSSKRKAN